VISLLQAVLWFTETQKPKSTLEEHTLMITDVRFSPSMSRLATSSFDRTVRVWDADNVSMHLFLFTHIYISFTTSWIRLYISASP